MQKVSIIVESVEWKVREMSVTYFILYTLFSGDQVTKSAEEDRVTLSGAVAMLESGKPKAGEVENSNDLFDDQDIVAGGGDGKYFTNDRNFTKDIYVNN